MTTYQELSIKQAERANAYRLVATDMRFIGRYDLAHQFDRIALEAAAKSAQNQTKGGL